MKQLFSFEASYLDENEGAIFSVSDREKLRERELAMIRRNSEGYCRCKTKHGLVPAGHHALWAPALEEGPAGCSLDWPYPCFATKLVSCWAGNAPAMLLTGFSLTQLALAALGAYERCLLAVVVMVFL